MFRWFEEYLDVLQMRKCNFSNILDSDWMINLSNDGMISSVHLIVFILCAKYQMTLSNQYKGI